MLLSMRLVRHMLRDCSINKRYMVQHVPLLQDWLGGGTGAAAVLREIFADNAEMLDLVEKSHITRFVELIRDVGRETRFVDFLTVLCECDDRPVRSNQWRVCKLLVEKSNTSDYEMRKRMAAPPPGLRSLTARSDGKSVVDPARTPKVSAFDGSRSRPRTRRWASENAPERHLSQP